MTDYRTIEDEYGKLTQRLSARGRWINVSREINGITFILDYERRTVDYALALKAGGVGLRLNDMDDRIEIWGDLPDLPGDPTPLNDILQANVTNWLQDIGLVGKDRMLDTISTVAWRNRYHPVKDYLNGLRWDGADHLTALLDMLSMARETEGVGRTFFRRWLIGAVAKIMEAGQNFMLVLDGPQGVGKSYLVRWLCPLPDYFIEGAVHPDDKDSYKRLISNFIWEVGELEGTTRKADRAALKDFITRREVTIRLPYARHDITKYASASLIGTINEDGAGFLNDPTGSRRFAVIKFDHIDFAYTNIDLDQLWAQIVASYRAGEPWELQPNERLLQHIVNEGYEADSPAEEYLRQHFTWSVAKSEAGEDFIPSVEIMGELKLAGLGGNERANMMEVSTILKREGLAKKRIGGLHGFYGIRKKTAREREQSVNGWQNANLHANLNL